MFFIKELKEVVKEYIRKFIGWVLVIIPSYIIISIMVQNPKSLMNLFNWFNLFNKVLIIIILIFIGGIGSLLIEEKK